MEFNELFILLQCMFGVHQKKDRQPQNLGGAKTFTTG